MVEVDATYYALPTRQMGELWLERTPPDFTFDIKAHALMTGQPSEVKRLPKEIRKELPVELAARRASTARTCLRSSTTRSGRFGTGSRRCSRGQARRGLPAVPALVLPSNESRDAIVEARQRLGEHLHGGRVPQRDLVQREERRADDAFLEEHQIPFVMVDEPQGYKLALPPIVAVTSPDLAVVRFHGRRTETWEAKGIPVVERFRYLYDRDELGEWVPRIREAAGRCRTCTCS